MADDRVTKKWYRIRGTFTGYFEEVVSAPSKEEAQRFLLKFGPSLIGADAREPRIESIEEEGYE
jgi:hypothetical protein